MKCYKCGEELTNGDICTNCGCDMSSYKIVVKASNSYYNQGLMKASVRDLSGAVYCLRTSLMINKYNTKARNLLGLVYYEMGEVVEALSQWIISKNYKSEKNAADVFIKKVQSNQNKLEAMNQTIKKFNRCLDYAKDGSYDVAKIQLKKVIANNPNFIKAYLLYSLLSIKSGEYDKAKKQLNKVITIDKGNTLAQKYLMEIKDIQSQKKGNVDVENVIAPKKEKESDRRALSGHDVIIPKGSYKEPSNGAVIVVDLLIGVAIGAALIWFLIIPSKIKGVTKDNNNALKDYASKLSTANADVSRLTSEVESLRSSVEDLNNGSTASAENSDKYSRVLEAVDYYNSNNPVEAAKTLTQVDVTTLELEAARNVYNMVWTATFLPAYESAYNEGLDLYNKGDVKGAAEKEADAFTINPTEDAAFNAGKFYFEAEDKAKAKSYFEYVVNNYPNSRYTENCTEYLANIQ